MRNLLVLLILVFTSSVAWSAEPARKAEQWYKADLALIDVTLTDDQGDQTFFYLNSRGHATFRLNGQEKKGAITLAKDKAAAAFVQHIYSLPAEKMPQTKISAHIQRRIGNDTEHLIRYYASADETKVLRAHIEALSKVIR